MPANPRYLRHWVIEWVVVLVAGVGVALLLHTYVLATYFIPSGSMEPTLQIGDRIIVDKLSVEFGQINRGDIVVFKAPPKVASSCADAVPDLVKRVIGLPGDHLYSRGNTIYVNGAPLHEAWTHVEPLNGAVGSPAHPVLVPAGEYFMMGDNHPYSCDSRSWGDVPAASIIGKVQLRIWPLSRLHWF